MTTTRRQFALWSTAALLVGTRAYAEEPVQQAEAPQSATPPAPEPTRIVPGKTEIVGQELRVELVVTRGGKALSASASVSKAHYKLADGVHEIEWPYMNGQHPFGRRMMAPSIVDLPPKREVLAGTAHLMLTPEILEKNPVFHLEVTLDPTEGEPIVVKMPGFRVDGSTVPSS